MVIALWGYESDISITNSIDGALTFAYHFPISC